MQCKGEHFPEINTRVPRANNTTSVHSEVRCSGDIDKGQNEQRAPNHVAGALWSSCPSSWEFAGGGFEADMAKLLAELRREQERQTPFYAVERPQSPPHSSDHSATETVFDIGILCYIFSDQGRHDARRRWTSIVSSLGRQRITSREA